MRQVALAYAYILVLWGLASTQSAAAACDPELVPRAGHHARVSSKSIPPCTIKTALSARNVRRGLYFRLKQMPGGTFTHENTPPYHGARPK
jgi:hypothetical protein